MAQETGLVMNIEAEYRVADIVLGILTVLMISILVASEMRLFDPVPYRNVEVSDVRLSADNHLFVRIDYEKTGADCEYQRGQAFAILPGAREPVEFQPIRGAGQTSQRFEGQQTLRWKIDLNGWFPDEVEIWTRHDCEGQRIDRLMATIDVP